MGSMLLIAIALLAVRMSEPAPGLSLFAERGSPSDQAEAEAALHDVKERYHANLQSWNASLGQLTASIDKFAKETASPASHSAVPPAEYQEKSPSVQEQFLEARRQYKRLEWLLAHLDEEAVRLQINGAPLPSVEKKVAELRVLQPAGFQPLEELVFEENLDLDARAQMRLLSQDLLAASGRVLDYQTRRKLTHAQVWSAARYGLLRIFSMGVTGFDTPASGEALSENALAMESISIAMQPYFRLLEDTLAAKLTERFELGIHMLKTGTFDEFDRVGFYTASIRPLYAALLDAQKALQIELPDQDGQQVLQHNYNSRDLFADDFLNDYVFAGQPAQDPLFSRKQELGKRLFYDVNLSKSRNLSCASCHKPDKAFSDGEVTSLGSDGTRLKRNAPTLIGAVFAERYFADMREPQLARQIRHVIQDEHEFATSYIDLIDRLSKDSSYVRAFEEAYADAEPRFRISSYSLGDALASYVRGLHANASPVDKYLRGESDELSEEVRLGMNLFMGKAVCATCHFPPTWAGLVPPYYRESESEVLGVPDTWPVGEEVYLDSDPGRIATGMPLDEAPFYAFSFKTPTVRNAALTAPYMHNGVLPDLESVVEFYKVGGGVGLGMKLDHQTLPFDSLVLDEKEQRALVAFMQALSDEVNWE